VFITGLSTGWSIEREEAWTSETGGSAPPQAAASLRSH
jgi:hypothetical protein